MKRAILVLAGFACCGASGCDTQSTAKMILTVGLNTRAAPQAADVVPTRLQPRPRPVRRPASEGLVAAMQELNRLPSTIGTDQDAAARLASLIQRITTFAAKVETESAASSMPASQARGALAVALARAAEVQPAEFTERLDAYSRTTFGRVWDRHVAEKQAVNRLVSDYLVAPQLPSDAAPVLALHTATFPHHPMNVELYTTMADRLVAERDLRAGLELARSGLVACANHADVSRLQDRVKRICREHPGKLGVPMNFAGPTIREPRFALSSLQGRPALVVFWSVTDLASDEFMVSCNKLAQRYPATEIEVVGVSLNANREDLEFWYFTHGFACPHVFSEEAAHAGFENPIARFYGVTTVPQFFLLDRDGIVIARGAGDLGMIEQELRQLPPAGSAS